MNAAGTPQPGAEDEEIERLADQIEAAWDANPDADVSTVLRSDRPSLLNLPRSLPYWVAGGIAAVVLAIYPIFFRAPVAGLVPLLLFVLAALVFVAGATRIPTLERRWDSLAVGLLGLLLMAVSPVMRGIDVALTAPTDAPPLAALTNWLVGAQAVLWALGVVALFASWLLATRLPALALVVLPIFGVGVLFVQWVVSLLGTLSWSGRPFPLATPILSADWGNPDAPSTGGDPIFFIVSRAIEVVGVLLCLRLATVFVKRAAVAREAALSQPVRRADATVGSVSGSQVHGVERTNTLAILSLIFAFVFPLIGVILGHVARSQIRRTGEQGMGLTFAALIIGYIAIGVVLLILIISAVVGLVSRGF